MWPRIINYKGFTRYGVQLGALVENSKHHRLGALVLGERRNRYIFRLDRMLFNYFSNRLLINKIAFSGGNFLFMTSRTEYYDTIRHSADTCAQTALLWRSSALGDLNTRFEVLDELYVENSSAKVLPKSYPAPNVFVLFDNEKFRSKRLIKEANKFLGIPLFSVTDTDSITRGDIFPIIGNDDSTLAIYFYSFFVAHSIISGVNIRKPFNYDKKTMKE